MATETTELVCMASPLPLFWVVLQRNLLMCVVTSGSTSGSTTICPWLWSVETLPAYWPVCKFDMTFFSCFQCTNHHRGLPLAPVSMCSYCIPNHRSFCKIHCSLILSARSIVPSVAKCYLVHWLNILSIAQHMMRVQRGVMFHIAWNLCGYNIMFLFKVLEQHCLMLSCRHLRKRNNVVIMFQSLVSQVTQ